MPITFAPQGFEPPTFGKLPDDANHHAIQPPQEEEEQEQEQEQEQQKLLILN